MKRIITIEIADDGGSGDYTVREGDRYRDSLYWDEMLGTVAELTHPRIGKKAQYRLVTAEQHAEHERRCQERLAGTGVSEV